MTISAERSKNHKICGDKRGRPAGEGNGMDGMNGMDGVYIKKEKKVKILLRVHRSHSPVSFFLFFFLFQDVTFSYLAKKINT